MTRTHFTQGSATAYVADGVLAMACDGGVDADLMSRCASNDEWSDLVAAFQDCADGAVVQHDDRCLRVAVVGSALVTVAAADGDHRVTGGTEWRAHEFEGVRTVTIRSGGVEAATELPYCVDAGAIPAAELRRRLSTVEDDASDPFESLFGSTVARAVESAAVRSVAGDFPQPRPPLGILVFSTGERVVVDRSIVLGRNPRTVDMWADDVDVRRVKVSSAGVSRQHAVIRVDRWHASIDDLGSANGTTVARPRQPAAAVRPGHPVDLVPGVVVDLGGDVSFAVEEVA
jgi:hypothetical protein